MIISICMHEKEGTSLIICQLLISCSAKILFPLGMCDNEADILFLFPTNEQLEIMPKPSQSLKWVLLPSLLYFSVTQKL